MVDKRDRGRMECLWVTSVSRTLIDLAGVVDEMTLELAIESARRRRIVSDARLRADFERLASRGRAGTGRFARVLRLLDGTKPAESILEVKVLRVLRSAGIPAPMRQYDVVVNGRRYRIDIAWPALRVGIECEGFAVHGRRSAYVPDRKRLGALKAAGWRIIPVTWEQTAVPTELASVVKQTLPEAAS
jgi:very-short-patch-repair endonuclease